MNTIYNRNNHKITDLMLLRLISIIAGIFTLIITIVWIYTFPDFKVSITICSIFLSIFLIIFILTYISKFVQKNAMMVLYIICYTATFSIILNAYESSFPEHHAWLLVFILFTVSQVMKKTAHLVWYIAITLFLFITALFLTKNPGVSRINTVLILVMYSIIAYVNFKSRINAQNALFESERDYRNLIEISPLAIIVHKNGLIEFANPTAVELIHSKDANELIGTSIYDYIHPDYSSPETLNRLNITNDKNQSNIEVKLCLPDKNIVDVEVNSTIVKYQGEPAVMSIIHDITERKKNDTTIKKMAYYDKVTGLPNRYSLYKFFSEKAKQFNTQELGIGIMFIDLDKFKIINDTLGHDIGDLLLNQVSQRLHQSIRKQDMVARYGGDEFIIALIGVNKEKCAEVAQKIIYDFSYPFYVNEHEIFVSPSIGISMFPTDGDNIETLIKNADAAMYHIKEKGKNNYQFFNEELNQIILRKIKLEGGLRKAIAYNELVLYFQPQVDIKTEVLCGLEVLIRWNHPVMGIIPPSEFISLAEETGLIISIGEWLIENACLRYKKLREAGLPQIPIAINVSGYQLKHSNFVETVRRLLKKTDFDANCLVIEITESVMHDVKIACQVVNDLKAMGVKTAIDDFGTGYSSLNLIKDIPIDYLKIDSSFINDICSNPNTFKLTKLITEIGAQLGFSIIAEGIETEEQAAVLKQTNCSIAQGFLYGRPLSEADFIKSFL